MPTCRSPDAGDRSPARKRGRAVVHRLDDVSARTFTVTVASSQFEGDAISQIRGPERVGPRAARGDTHCAGGRVSQTPSEVDDSCFSVTFAGVTPMPPSRSLARTFETAVPGLPSWPRRCLSTASITKGLPASPSCWGRWPDCGPRRHRNQGGHRVHVSHRNRIQAGNGA